MANKDLDGLQREIIALENLVGGVAAATGATMTSGSSITMATDYLLINKASGSPTAVTLPSAPVPFVRTYNVKDGKGDAATNNITITPSSGLIDGAASFVMNVNFMSASFLPDGTNWSVV